MTSPISSNWFYYMTMASMAQAMPSMNLSGRATNSLGNAGNENTLFLMLLNAAMHGRSDSNNATSLPFSQNQMMPQMNSPFTLPVNVQAVDKIDVPTSPNDTSDFHFKPVQLLKLDTSLEGKLSGSATHFINAGKKYDIDPSLLSAIAIHETGNGSSRAVNEKNNVAGMMGKNGLRSYESVEDSIFDMARNLRKNYLNQGKDTIAEIGAKYAPIGVANDPTGLNNHWTKGVSRQFNNLS
ncbi:glucosaminidase domain-containing protein [Paenisporosarcina quisquiliarum]|uniref:Glucosaminidase domain-containing protein n=1 Tax=Paenisporosarcina quisquiliarum TaxID=365346 RepID=A0A9X3LH67_9BACL|nr:glucosaminidase domain-containing protein [Paenisporosarcina quisquiliarum]MCZ8536931.1 glucosaminidase domain-containing protein [Paenisporosarcina quisquiliarum]